MTGPLDDYRGRHQPQLFDAQIEPLRANLIGQIETVEEMREGFEHQPTDGSIAAAEVAGQAAFAGEWGSTPAYDALCIIWALVTAAEGHLHSMSTLLRQPKVNPTSIDVLARTALETLARAVWLAEPALGAETRLKRAKTERLYSAAEQAKLGPVAQGVATDVRDRILRTADNFGWVKLPAKRGTPPRFEERPAATTLVGRLMLDHKGDGIGEFAYRLLSASAHGTIYGLVRHIERVQDFDDGTSLGATRVSSIEVRLQLAIGTVAYLAVMDRVLLLFGWHEHPAWVKSAQSSRALVTRVARELHSAR